MFAFLHTLLLLFDPVMFIIANCINQFFKGNFMKTTFLATLLVSSVMATTVVMADDISKDPSAAQAPAATQSGTNAINVTKNTQAVAPANSAPAADAAATPPAVNYNNQPSE